MRGLVWKEPWNLQPANIGEGCLFSRYAGFLKKDKVSYFTWVDNLHIILEKLLEETWWITE